MTSIPQISILLVRFLWPKQKLYVLNWPAGHGHDYKWGAILLVLFSFNWMFFSFLGRRISWTLFNIVAIYGHDYKWGAILLGTDHLLTSYFFTFFRLYRSTFNMIPILIQHCIDHHSTSYRSLFNIVPTPIQHRTDHCSTLYRLLFNIIPISIQHRTNHLFNIIPIT